MKVEDEDEDESIMKKPIYHDSGFLKKHGSLGFFQRKNQ